MSKKPVTTSANSDAIKKAEEEAKRAADKLKQEKAAKKAADEKAKEEKKKEREAAAAEKAKAKALLIPTVASKALSTDVGPSVIAQLAKSFDDEEKVITLSEEIEAKRYDALARTTLAIVKAAEADDEIDLAAAFKDDKKAMTRLNEQLGIAMGVRVVEEYGKGDKKAKRVVYSPAVTKFFPQPKDDKDAPLTKKKATLRTNYIHMLKKCAMAAHGIIARGIDAKLDKDSGTLLLSGPAVSQTFGAKTVLLNEKQKVDQGAGKEPVTLKAKPSFTAIANLGAAKEGVEVKSRVDSRAKVTDPVEAIKALSKAVVAACEKLTPEMLKNHLEAMRPDLNAIRNAVEEVLGIGQKA